MFQKIPRHFAVSLISAKCESGVEFINIPFVFSSFFIYGPMTSLVQTHGPYHNGSQKKTKAQKCWVQRIAG